MLFMYHAEHGARLFASVDEFEQAGDGWVDTPAKLPAVTAPTQYVFAAQTNEGHNVALTGCPPTYEGVQYELGRTPIPKKRKKAAE